jgi:hypothetical protein
MKSILGVSQDITLLTMIHDLLRQERLPFHVLVDDKRLVPILARSAFQGILCCDLAAPSLMQLLHLLPTLSSAVTLVLLGSPSAPSLSEHSLTWDRTIPTFALPEDAAVFRRTIRHLVAS